jgi:hypothetical protein
MRRCGGAVGGGGDLEEFIHIVSLKQKVLPSRTCFGAYGWVWGLSALALAPRGLLRSTQKMPGHRERCQDWF